MTLPQAAADEEEALAREEGRNGESTASPLTSAKTGLEGEEQQQPSSNGDDSNNERDDDDDDNITVILLDPNDENNHHPNVVSLDWINQQGPEMEERRRNVLLRELKRIQRASFLHFALLCLIPTVLVLVVVLALLSDTEECTSEVTFCELESRSFVNAFTSRCICDPIPVERTGG